MTRVAESTTTDELCELFDDYTQLLTQTAGHGPARLTPGLHGFAVEHIRRTVAALRAHYAVELAHGETDEGERARRRLEHFESSLPVRSTLWSLVPLAAILVLAQILSPIGPSIEPIASRISDLSDVATLDPTKISKATKTLLDSSFLAVLYIAWVFALATLIVQWPRRRAFRLLRALLGVDGPYLRVGELKGGDGKPIRIRDRERMLFARVGAELPAVGSFDLLVAAVGGVVVALMGVDVLDYIVSGYDDTWSQRLRDGLLGSGLVCLGAGILIAQRVHYTRRRRDGNA